MVDQNNQTDVEKCIKQIRMVYIHNRGVFASQKSFCNNLIVNHQEYYSVFFETLIIPDTRILVQVN
ncbi:unnamed protein product [Paramecium primaurelia]|uniref:Uncharacterized protein n=1 Tax=Paramecium primaurelia TaxID=5886 RepID=A0A8S1M8Y6_PARPR|nr:unnamed protein product [Paramecium primaurelia]